jgi:LPXTG-site transpeptidase (sortase) family protein
MLPEQLPPTPAESASADGNPSLPAPGAAAPTGDPASAAAPPLAETTPPGPPPAAVERSSPRSDPGPTSEPLVSPSVDEPTPPAQPGEPLADAEERADEQAPTNQTATDPTPAAAVAAPPPQAGLYGRAMWISIPRIRVDSRVVEVGVLADGEFQAPAFAVGHHVGSPNPGQAGNSVFAGHLTSINAGRVFARLRELRPGDAVYVYSQGYRLDWVVNDVRTVPNSDSSFILPTGDTRITLYTCAGHFLPLTRDYSDRLVVTARLVRAEPRT